MNCFGGCREPKTPNQFRNSFFNSFLYYEDRLPSYNAATPINPFLSKNKTALENITPVV